MPQPRTVLVAVLLAPLVLDGACHSTPASPPAQPSEHALSGLAAQHVVILPTYTVRVMPALGWTIPRAADVERGLDSDIVAAFKDRSIKGWIFPADLERSYQRNQTYASDPHELAEEPFRSPSLAVDQRLPEPIASELRTMVALHEGARLVLAPVELRFEPAGAGMGRAVLRLVLVDARLSSVRWLGDVASEPASAFGPALTASIAAKLSAIVAP